MRESKIEMRLTQLAAKHKFICWKWQSSRRGVPDRIVIAKGRTIFVELKATTGVVTPQQEHVHTLMRAQGAEVVVIDSLEGVDDLVESLAA